MATAPKTDMVMQVAFFEGATMQMVEDKFNAWSNGSQWISNTSLAFRGKNDENAVMQVVYAVKADEYLSDDARRKKRRNARQV